MNYIWTHVPFSPKIPSSGLVRISNFSSSTSVPSVPSVPSSNFPIHDHSFHPPHHLHTYSSQLLYQPHSKSKERSRSCRNHHTSFSSPTDQLEISCCSFNCPSNHSTLDQEYALRLLTVTIYYPIDNSYLFHLDFLVFFSNIAQWIGD